MLKKSTLEDIISKDLAAIWAILTPDERRLVADNFHIHNFKKNQIIYAEKESVAYMDTLRQFRFEPGEAYEYINPTFQVLRLLRHLLWVQFQ